MQRAELLEFVQRDRAAVEALHAAHWREYHRVAAPLAALELADQLRQYAISLHPGWPDQVERNDDLAVHRRLAETLRRVGTIPTR